MTCFYPVKAWPVPGGKPSFSSNKSYVGAKPISLPCGRCDGCRLGHTAQWAIRAMHEVKMHEVSCFASMTFDDEHYPANGSLDIGYIRQTVRTIRRLAGPCRYLACGEYGSRNKRPHYHFLFFGFRPNDLEPLHRSDRGDVLYSSRFMETKVWPHGIVMIGDVTQASAAYVAGYTLDKQAGIANEVDHKRAGLLLANPVSGEIQPVRPEFITMSTKPGIGSAWYDAFASDAFPSDFLIMDGRRVGVPLYYLRKLKAEDAMPLDGDTRRHHKPGTLIRLKAKRAKQAHETAHDRTPERLEVREESLKLRTKQLVRMSGGVL